MSYYCAGKKHERRLKRPSGDDAEEEDEDDDDSPEVESSDPMMGFTFNECKPICECEIFNRYYCNAVTLQPKVMMMTTTTIFHFTVYIYMDIF